jgi:hypothetical protein
MKSLSNSGELWLRSGLPLFASLIDGQYWFGPKGRRTKITSQSQRAAIEFLSRGIDPRSQVGGDTPEISSLIESLRQNNLLLERRGRVALPKRYLAEIHHRDIAAQQLLQRAAPEERDAQWRIGDRDGGSSILSERARHRIVISGRSRFSTLLTILLSQSGFTAIDFDDSYESPLIDNFDIGVGIFTARDFGGNFYQLMSERRVSTALFPDSSPRTPERAPITPTLVIHYGHLDIERIVDWMTSAQSHLVISPPAADEAVISPIVLPGKTPCTRCFHLYQLDKDGFSRYQSIDCDDAIELSIVAAHHLASIVAHRVIAFIDSISLESDGLISQGVGEATYLEISTLEQSQVGPLPRHPLCGCSYI